MSKKQSGFTVFEVVLSLVLIVIVVSAGFYMWPHTKKTYNNTTTNTVVQNGEVTLYGKITEDDCFMGNRKVPIGDVGCSITVSGYSIGVVWGNTAPPKTPGVVTGLNVNQDQTNHYARIYAKQVDNRSASIWDASKYYVKIY